MRATFAVHVDGQNITGALSGTTSGGRPILIGLSVSDKAGQSSDTASLEIDDTDGAVVMPSPGASVLIFLGWEGEGMGLVFQGTVDDQPRARGGRGGRTLLITAKGMDTRGKAKEGQRRHFDDKTIEEALQEAGRYAGLLLTVDPELGRIKRPYMALDDESFAAFGERMAREVGGTFKIAGDRAILAKRNGGTSASGAALAGVTAAWGVNLHDYDIVPSIGRATEKEAIARWYDPRKAEWQKEAAETGTEGGTTTKPARFTEPDLDRAKEQAGSDAAESDRKSGEGSVTIEGNLNAQPEGVCMISGCRPGVDGAYRIEGVTHDYSRGGWITRLELGQPKGTAGKDNRGGSGGGDGDDFSLPADPELG